MKLGRPEKTWRLARLGSFELRLVLGLRSGPRGVLLFRVQRCRTGRAHTTRRRT